MLHADEILRTSVVRASYDSAAEAYAEHLFDELQHKPLDRTILSRFAEAVKGKGEVLDLGCGPGHVAKYLSQLSVRVRGVDLSPAMVRCAVRLCPGIQFQVGDMRALDVPDAALGGAVAFYSIVHFETGELASVFRELRRVLVSQGMLLLAFHVGEETVHVHDMWGQPVSLEFRFHPRQAVVRALSAMGFRLIECVERDPYPDVEYPSRRCYITATAVSPTGNEATT